MRPRPGTAAWTIAVPLPSSSALHNNTSVCAFQLRHRRKARHYQPHMCSSPAPPPSSSSPHLDRLRVVTVPDESHMLSPGEVRNLSLDYALFTQLLQGGSVEFGVMNISNWRTMRRGMVLSILNVRNLSHDNGPKIEVECRCSRRFDLVMDTENMQQPDAWMVVDAQCTRVNDWMAYKWEDRLRLSFLEWKVWQKCKTTLELLREMDGSGKGVDVNVVQQLSVWAPREYDREIEEEEWDKTPMVTRQVYCERAEFFSFGVLRAVMVEDKVMIAAREMTNTCERLELAEACVEGRQKKTAAQLSLKKALS